MKQTILILTTHTGGGHLNLAQSLKDSLESYYDVVIVDPQPDIVDWWYATVSRYSVKFLEWQFTLTDNAKASLWLHRALTLFSRRQIFHILERVQPHLIIATHAMLSYPAARAHDSLPERVPLIFQLTDLGQIHMTWFSEQKADAYLVPTREIYAQARQVGVDKERLHLTGRPIRRQFLEVSLEEREITLQAIGLDPALFTIFLQGGAKGSAGVERIIDNLLRLHVSVQIILAAGNNKAIAARYATVRQVHVLSFTETIAPYMAAADIIAGKAGASFISEAFMVEEPFVVTTYIPGQETPNLRFIQQHNLGWVCLNIADQQALFAKLVSDPTYIAEKVESIRVYKNWNVQANHSIVPVIDSLLAKPVNATGS